MSAIDAPGKTPERWRRVEALYHEICALPAGERAAAVASRCSDDPALAREVQALLEQSDSGAGIFGVPPMEAAARVMPARTGALNAGQRLGAFEIVKLLGSGGMGEVYRARDIRLNRSVAIKVLPTHLSSDPERRARFDREAKAVSSLNHPHICTLHDVGHQDGIDYLVMELIEGETLADRLRKGALPLDLTLRTAIEIADALDKAHRHGVVHRDLKPGNIMLTKSGAKLLDFGLAKQSVSASGSGAASALPTRDRPLTDAGAVLGTFQYMSPEQLEGREADARSDLWALGCVTYEMATGKRAFEGKSQASLVTAIMTSEPPPIAGLQPLAPPALERLVRVCLAKDPDDRMQTAHDVMQELKWIGEAGPIAPPGPTFRGHARWKRALGATGVVAAILALAAIGARWLREPVAPAVVRSTLDVLPAQDLYSGDFSNRPYTPGGGRTALAWTPDGHALVFVGRNKDGVRQLYVRDLDQDHARVLAGTEEAAALAMSPEGRSVAFWSVNTDELRGALKSVALEGGPVTVLAEGLNGLGGMAYGARGDLFYAAAAAIRRVMPSAPPALVTSPDERRTLPSFMPGGQVMLCTSRKRGFTWGDEQIEARILATGERKVLLNDAVDARYLPTGHLVFLRRGTLFGVEFDEKRLEVRGSPVALVDGVAQALTAGNARDRTGAGQFSVSSNGTLAYVAGPLVPSPAMNLVAVDRAGRVSPLPAPVRSYSGSLDVSPDGSRLVAITEDLTEGPPWIVDIARGTLSKLASDGEASWPSWTPDGQRVAFIWRSDGQSRFVWQRADGTAPPEELPGLGGVASSWSPDGKKFVVARSGDIWVGSIEGSKVSGKQITHAKATERGPEISPDGKWLAYDSDATGRLEVYVTPFPGPGPSLQVSLEGAGNPAWNPAGGELFFLAPAPPKVRMMAVDIKAGPKLTIGTPHVLFDFIPTILGFGCDPVRCYAVAPDGQRFFVTQPVPVQPLPPVTHIRLVTGWAEEVKAKVAAGQPK